MIGTYTSTRARGLAPWRPQKKTCVILEQIRAVLAEYQDHLPLTCRQIFYRLVGAHGYAKKENAYERLLGYLNRARRAGMIPFDHIRDDGATASLPGGFDGKPDFWNTVHNAADHYHRDRLAGQSVELEIWVEAAGMAPQIARVAHPYGVPVYSSGGFDSLSTRWDAVQRIANRARPTFVLHVGDHDPSGVAIFDSTEADVSKLLADATDKSGVVWFARVAVTPEQIERYGLLEAPPKGTDRRGQWKGGTVQAEALSPAALAEEVEQAIRAHLDLDLLERIKATEPTERLELLAEIGERPL